MQCPQHKKTVGAFRPLEHGFQRFLLHKSDNFRLITLMQERFQLSLKITYVGHS